jgi:DNA-binding winged helix-turn-helix (wHTH) protein
MVRQGGSHDEMNRSTNLAERVRFGSLELNIRTGELVSIGTAASEAGSAKILLREQPFQILRILVERQGKIVTRQEIKQILWPNDTVVEFDRSINVAIAILRKVLDDDADNPKYIETLPRRGYRLIAPVEWQQSSTGGTPVESQVATPPPLPGGGVTGGSGLDRYWGPNENFVHIVRALLGGFQPHGVDEIIEGLKDGGVSAVEGGDFCRGNTLVSSEGLQDAGSERSIKFVVEL